MSFFNEAQLKELNKTLKMLENKALDVESRVLLMSELLNTIHNSLKEDCKNIANTIKMFLKIKGQSDPYLVKVLKSRSRASELLNSKRTPTLSDIKLLNTYLGIPPSLLITPTDSQESIEEYSNYPIKEILKRGWVANDNKLSPEQVMEEFCRMGNCSLHEIQAACFRKSKRDNTKTDLFAQQAWLIKARIEAEKVNIDKKFNPSILTQEFLEKFVQELSAQPNGPKEAQTYLANQGIRLVIVKHLKGTYLDGAVFYLQEGQPVVAMTLRYDRLDNFWFTLMHELSHLSLKHLNEDTPAIFDDLDLEPMNQIEIEADTLAKKVLIPDAVWGNFPVDKCRQSDIFNLAISLVISPAIIAGRIRFETKNYRAFSGLVGNGEVRRLFEEVVT